MDHVDCVHLYDIVIIKMNLRFMMDSYCLNVINVKVPIIRSLRNLFFRMGSQNKRALILTFKLQSNLE